MYVLCLLDARGKILLKRSRCARLIEQIIATCTKQPQNIHNYKLSFEKINTCDTAKYYHIHKKQIIINTLFLLLCLVLVLVLVGI